MDRVEAAARAINPDAWEEWIDVAERALAAADEGTAPPDDPVFTIEPQMPRLVLATKSAGRMRLQPQKDITAYEMAKIMEMLVCAMTPMAYVDVEGWWEQAGPGIWRHFEAEG